MRFGESLHGGFLARQLMLVYRSDWPRLLNIRLTHKCQVSARLEDVKEVLESAIQVGHALNMLSV